jgi:hypothetical protein
MASRERGRNLQRSSAELVSSIPTLVLVRMHFLLTAWKNWSRGTSRLDTHGGIINASGALHDVDKPPETPAELPSVPKLFLVALEFTSGEERGALTHPSLSADGNEESR